MDDKARAAKGLNLASTATLNLALFGAVFAVRDKWLNLPEGRSREPHPTRRVIIAQGHHLVRAASPPTILVIPCSTTRVGRESCDMRVPPNEHGFTEPVVWAFVSLLQPVLKSDLEKYYGQLSTAAIVMLQKKLANALGLAPHSDPAVAKIMPPRP